MSLLFRRAAAATEERAVPATDVPLTRTVNGDAGDTTMSRALRIIPVYAAVSLLTESLISLPLHAYETTAAGRKRIPDPELLSKPSTSVDALAWRGQYVASLLLRGNAYGYATALSPAGQVLRLEWLHPDTVTVTKTGSRPRYSVNGNELDTNLVTHVRSVTLPGEVVALSPIAQFRVQLAAAMHADALRSDLYHSGAPAAHMRNTEKVVSADEAAIIKRRTLAATSTGDLLVTGKDWEYKALGLSPADAQFVESAQLTANQIAAIYHVPPEEIGGTVSGSSLTYATLEMNDLKFTRRSLLPLTVRLELALADLLGDGRYAKFNLDAYVRTDLRSRMVAHEIALRTGLETQDEGRALEDRAPLTPAEIEFWATHYSKLAASQVVEVPAPEPPRSTT